MNNQVDNIPSAETPHLEPCPFCGEGEDLMPTSNNSKVAEEGHVNCCNCGASGPSYIYLKDMKEPFLWDNMRSAAEDILPAAIKDWNKRSTDE